MEKKLCIDCGKPTGRHYLAQRCPPCTLERNKNLRRNKGKKEKEYYPAVIREYNRDAKRKERLKKKKEKLERELKKRRDSNDN